MTIPEQDKPAFRTLLRLSDAQMTALVDALKTAAPARYLRDLSAELAATTSLDFDSLYELTKVLAFFAWWREDEELDLDELVHDVAESVKDDAELGTDSDVAARASTRLRRILEASDVLRITSKASELLSESERRLCAGNCRIISEIRPIFPSQVSGKPDAAVTTHTLKLAYHESGDEVVKEFFVSLDYGDLQVLWVLIDRAIEKETGLREFVKASGVVYINGRENNDAAS